MNDLIQAVRSQDYKYLCVLLSDQLLEISRELESISLELEEGESKKACKKLGSLECKVQMIYELTGHIEITEADRGQDTIHELTWPIDQEECDGQADQEGSQGLREGQQVESSQRDQDTAKNGQEGGQEASQMLNVPSQTCELEGTKPPSLPYL